MIKLQRIHNARDLGSFQVVGKDGVVSRTVDGVFIRSGSTSDATELDVGALVGKLGVRTILDLRNRNEVYSLDRANRAEKIFPLKEDVRISMGGMRARRQVSMHNGSRKLKKVMKPTGTTLYALALYAFGEKLLKIMYEKVLVRMWRLISQSAWVIFSDGVFTVSPEVPRVLKSLFELLVFRATMCKYAAYFGSLATDRHNSFANFYFSILKYNGAHVAKALKICAEPSNQPVIIHCTSGKDRTGLIVAMLLAAVGVPKDEIVEDYCRSHDFGFSKEHMQTLGILKERVARGKGAPAWMKKDEEHGMILGATQKSIEGMFELVEEEFGTCEKYLDSIGFDDTWREKLRASFVVDPVTGGCSDEDRASVLYLGDDNDDDGDEHKGAPN